MKKSTRKVIAQDTLKILEQGYYTNDLGEEVNIAKAQKNAVSNTVLYRPEELLELIDSIDNQPSEFETEFVVNAMTTLDSVRNEYNDNQRILFLNFLYF